MNDSTMRDNVPPERPRLSLGRLLAAALAALAVGVALAVSVAGLPSNADARCRPRTITSTSTDTRPALAARNRCRRNGGSDNNNNNEEPDLDVSQSLTPDPPRVGQPLTYAITVLNHGSVTATDVELLAQVPPGADFQSLDATESCFHAGGWVTCSVEKLGEKESATFHFTVIPRQGGPLVNQLDASSDEKDLGEPLTSSVVAIGAAARPVLHRSVAISIVSGTIFVRVPGSTEFRELVSGATLPLGTVIDARQGRIRLTSAAGPGGALQSADFFAGMFAVFQTLGVEPFTELRLVGGNFAVCRTAASSSVKQLTTGRRVVRKLWGTGTGRFRTRGRFGAATVRGTTWLTKDRCDATWIFVPRGTVSVFDLIRRRTVIVTTGHGYLARTLPPSGG